MRTLHRRKSSRAYTKRVSSVTDPFADARQIEKQLIEHVYSHKAAEIAAKSCLSGPHKDDLELLLDGRSAASFGSQGQVRTLHAVPKARRARAVLL